ncbi:hypothetical protein GCM10025771_19720 [Niveibacterium umoris]|uniref:histidine kinase n=1 Tax=Niveibacterium umoris TaxID=1193620 RepID=A0A840BIN1_9RHOO|nr:substrate-binding domain-containing protein [Niveibacterium umoris]MBB4012840.1 DNA-binding LacI/PurR family transcriptional regulator/signal transduction histidine kinase [Niveibacterium umoris]
MAGRKRIGFLINHLGWEGHYTNRLWRCAVAHCRRRGFDLMVFTGPQDVSDYVSVRVQSALFRLIDERRIDGLVLNPGLKYFNGGHAFSEHPRDFGRIPMVSIAETLPGVPSVLVDNATGMRELVEHLILHHGHRRQAFICGPSNSEDGSIRYAAWLQTLRAHGIEPDPELVLAGNFVSVHEPHHLVEAWRTGRKFDAVVAASDLMATQIVAVLGAAGIRVPEDVAVVGFDGDPGNRYADPPLSSVLQPIRAQAETAIDLLADMWRGGKPAPVTTLPSTMQIRASCGCCRTSWSVDPALRSSLIDAANKPESFANAVSELIGSGEDAADRAFDIWSAMEADAGDQMGSLARLRPEQLHAVRSELFYRTVSESKSPHRAAPVHPGSDWSAVLDALRVSSLSSLPGFMAKHLPSLGVGKYCLSVFPNLVGLAAQAGHAGFSQIDVSEAALGIEGGVNSDTQFAPAAMYPQRASGVDPTPFDAALIAPDAWFDLLEESTLLVLPVASRSTWHGLLAIELHPGQEGMLVQLQAALALVCERESELGRAVRKHLAEWGRTTAVAERSRTIATLVRGVAHEINTPLGVSVTVASVLRSELLGLEDKYQTSQLTRRAVLDFLSTSKEALEHLDRNLNRVAKLVETFKKVSITQYGDQRVEFDLVGELAAVLQFFKVELDARFIHARIEAVRPMWMRAHVSVVQEIVTDLVQNALDHAFPPGMQTEPRIVISAELLDGASTARIRVADNGAGISADMRGRVFDPFFTTRRMTGNVGLGLSIVSNLVAEGLGGIVECLPNPGGGTAFEIRFPVKHGSCS